MLGGEAEGVGGGVRGEEEKKGGREEGGNVPMSRGCCPFAIDNGANGVGG